MDAEVEQSDFITDFPDSNRFHGSAPCALTTPRSTSPDEFFGDDLGKLRASELAWCAVTKSIVRARGARRRSRAEEDPGDRFSDPWNP